MNALWWLRADMRTRDNPAFRAALEHGPVVAMFYVAPEQWRAHDDSAGKVDFWLRNLADLSGTLSALHVPLKIIRGTDWSSSAEDIASFCQHHNITAVHVNAEWGVNERERDAQVADALQDKGISFDIHQGATLLAPGSLLNGQGQPYKVFTPYARACRERLRSALPKPSRRPSLQAEHPRDAQGHTITADDVPTKVAGYETPGDQTRAFWPAGEEAASERLTAFADDAMRDYDTARDLPAQHGTSRLSAYLAAGVVSPVQCLYVALSINQGELDSGQSGVQTWVTEIIWREFYIHLLALNPHLSKHKPMQPHTEQVRWRDSAEDLEAWQAGRTGIPIVDAAMKQLTALGWMHNRLRMVTAMFLSKNLLLDWRQGEQWFMQHLVDGDLASNNGGWQWSASTGADAAPYFRVFNPVSQSQRFDPEGAFIRQWLPELASLSNKEIHQPAPAARQRLDYPDPIVDLSSSRRRAIEAFAGLSRKK